MWTAPLLFSSALAIPFASAAAVSSGVLTDNQVDVISARLAEASLQSWELGTRAQTILELNATTYSVLNTAVQLPPPAAVPSSLTSSMAPFFEIAHKVVSNRSVSNNNTVGPQPLMQDGSAADPASIGVSVLIANWTGQDGGSIDYAGAAADQLAFLLEKVPRTSDGAISHRVSQVQLWNDFVYMVPPFLAYYGVVTQNRSLIAEAYNQISLYRQYLRDTETGMWRHVLLGQSENDPGFWSTGNGWAAAGMIRVLMTMRQSQYTNTFHDEQNTLASWIHEIHTAILPHLDNTFIFTNYADKPPTAQGNFYDAASTALIASTIYRSSVLFADHVNIPVAENMRKALFATNSTGSSSSATAAFVGFQHLTEDGWLTPVVNPHSYGVEGSESAEGQAFVVQLHAAHAAWVKAGSKGLTGAAPRRTASMAVMATAGAAVLAWLL